MLHAFLWTKYARDANQYEALKHFWDNSKDEGKRQVLDQSLGGDLDDIIGRYPDGNKDEKARHNSNRVKRLAGVLYWLRNTIQEILDQKRVSAAEDYDIVKTEWQQEFYDLDLPALDLYEFR